ncbi:unnamed protein product, partial [Larinioides sclopetarius]
GDENTTIALFVREARTRLLNLRLPISISKLPYEGLEECLDYENMQREEDNRIKRKNTFSYPLKENLNSKKNMQSMTPRKGNTSSARNVNQLVKTTPMKQTILSTDAPNGFGFKLVQKEKKMAESLRDENSKLCPKWSPTDSSSKVKNKPGNKNITFPRIFTVTVEKLQTWPKVLSCGQIIFEVFGSSSTKTCYWHVAQIHRFAEIQ